MSYSQISPPSSVNPCLHVNNEDPSELKNSSKRHQITIVTFLDIKMTCSKHRGAAGTLQQRHI